MWAEPGTKSKFEVIAYTFKKYQKKYKNIKIFKWHRSAFKTKIEIHSKNGLIDQWFQKSNQGADI